MAKIVGELSLEKGFWRITCDAHVKLKLRRLFPEVVQHASEVLHLTDNIENCRDLFWFIERYPMVVSDLRYLERRAREHVILAEEIESIISGNIAIHEPFDLALPPREYQSVAAQLLFSVEGYLLGDDVGLGKTAASICPMTRPGTLPALVVTLAGTMPLQWQTEIAKFAPHLKTHVLTKGTPYSLTKKNGSPEDARFPDVIICNYAKLNGWAETLRGVVKYIIFDECQELRREDSLKYKAAYYLAQSTPFRIGLSATPIYNYGEEFFSVLNVLRPGALGSKDEFLREWCRDFGNNKGKIKDPKAFGEYLRAEGLLLRRTRREVGRELPPVQKIHQFVDCDLDVLNKIKGNAIELAKIILASQQQYIGQKFRASEEFNILMRQATGIAKAPYVAQFVKLLIESGEKVVLYGWHREVYSIWLEQLAEYNPCLYTGTESNKEKERTKQAFISGDCQVMIISLRSGVGLDGLQFVSRTTVFGELDWSPGVHEQCIGRLDRDGQLDSVSAYYLISESGSDPVIADVLGIKRGQIEGVRNPGEELFEKLEVDSNKLKLLAESYLNSVGLLSDAA